MLGSVFAGLASTASPSSRRAWVEISPNVSPSAPATVALLAEGVGRNIKTTWISWNSLKSPSSRRAWVEISRGRRRPPAAAGRPPRGGRG